jgi:hypothetical protein
MSDQPNKPGGDFERDDKLRNVEDEQAVKNQGKAKPDDYPEPASGDQAQ